MAKRTRYEIRIRGHLDRRWCDRLDGLSVEHAANGETRLTGPLPDQAALHGVLKQLRDLGVPLLSIETTEEEGS